jgi:two-component system chemotaxis response regulator CheY
MSNKPWVGKSVVIIDDSPSVREELKGTFTACGMEVKGLAENGVKGLDLVKELRPAIVSLDVIMPEMDGVECYRKINAFDPAIRVVMITWLAGETKILENLKDQIPSHLFQKKPVSTTDLEARLQKIYFPEKEKPTGLLALEETSNDFLKDLGVKAS